MICDRPTCSKRSGRIQNIEVIRQCLLQVTLGVMPAAEVIISQYVPDVKKHLDAVTSTLVPS
jgi:hypothetical protein